MQEQVASEPRLSALNKPSVLRGINILEKLCTAARPYITVVEGQIAKQPANSTRVTATRAERAATVALAELLVELATQWRQAVETGEVRIDPSASNRRGTATELVERVDWFVRRVGDRAQQVLDDPKEQTKFIVMTRFLLSFVAINTTNATEMVHANLGYARTDRAMEQQYEARRLRLQARLDGISAHVPSFSATLPGYSAAIGGENSAAIGGESPAEVERPARSRENRPGPDLTL